MPPYPSQSQPLNAQSLYNPRAATYDSSFHPRFAHHMVLLASPQLGEHILDLACGTGLATFSASRAVGPSGIVVGVDVSTGMLEVAEGKKRERERERDGGVMGNLQFLEGSITELEGVGELEGRKDGQGFDVITCCSALVLLPDATGAVKGWVPYLKPGGRLVVDVTHPQNLVVGMTFERVGRILDVHVPYYRLPFQRAEDLKRVMEEAGLERVEVLGVSQQEKEGVEDLEEFLTDLGNPRVWKEYGVDEADDIFDAQVDGAAAKELGKPEIRQKAKEVFRQEWAKVADSDGKIRDVDCVFVGIGYKP